MQTAASARTLRLDQALLGRQGEALALNLRIAAIADRLGLHSYGGQGLLHAHDGAVTGRMADLPKFPRKLWPATAPQARLDD